MSNPNSITRIMTAILLASTIMTILFVGIPDNMNIAYSGGDDSGRSIIDVSSVQGFKEIQNCGPEGIAVWCV
jgi:hypothetical protein